MKILVLSDLHLEYCAFTPNADAVRACDVVVLAGDIHSGVYGILWARQAFPGKPVVYVAGNHELYGGEWSKTLDKMRYTANVNNVHFLENDAIVIQGVRFLGCTLWTDFAYFGQEEAHEAMYQAEQKFSDYRAIANFFPECAITAKDTLERHQKSRAWLEAQAPKGDPANTVVVTHHYPHKNSTAPRWQQDDLTPAFGSQLPEELLLQAGGLWIHGHAHDSFNYRIDGRVNGVQRYTRVVCNPRGFPMGVDRLRMENSRFRSGLLITQMPDGNWGECV